ncbi:hypothetical protein RchiOBHm_Chr5g0000541 [Rosa chinensis]|uniref:Uncharacterized protein n=1 Tax=Rosa chinensis TaxID=74649 RepID=A0A2P6Q1Y4_ROSCH|nr:hypothetical protein RchiOBHm_Chr5g0000541 [Rosa chinensis]
MYQMNACRNALNVILLFICDSPSLLHLIYVCMGCLIWLIRVRELDLIVVLFLFLLNDGGCEK